MTTPYYEYNTNKHREAKPSPPIVVQGHDVVQGSTTYQSPNATAPTGVVSGVHHVHVDDVERPTESPRCRDVLWTILFYAHLIIMAWVAATFVPQMSNNLAADYAGGDNRRYLMRLRFLEENDDNNNNMWNYNAGANDNYNNHNGQDEISIDLGATLTVVALSGVSALLFSTLALGFMIAFAETLIKVGIVSSILLTFLSGLAALLVGQVGPALAALVASGLLLWYCCNVWSRIPFAAANLVTATTVVKANLGVTFYAYLSLLLTFGWAVWWTASAISTIFIMSDCQGDGTCEKEINGFLLFFFFVSYFWTVQVISNVVAVTVSGVTGTWWMAPHEASGCCSKAVTDSYFRAMTYSFGSVCLGSLIVALIQATREMVHRLRESDDSLLACCAEFLLSCIESLAEYFNQWAFVFVGVYGFSFMEAGMQVMTLFRNRGWTTIITDDLTERALLIVSFCVALLNGITGMVLGSGVGMGEGVPLVIPFLVGFLTGLTLCSTLFSVVGSACKSVIVLYAEKPNEFQANHPELSNRMRACWHQAWPVDFKY